MGLGQYNSLREYCGLSTASYVFLISKTSLNPFSASDHPQLDYQNQPPFHMVYVNPKAEDVSQTENFKTITFMIYNYIYICIIA